MLAFLSIESASQQIVCKFNSMFKLIFRLSFSDLFIAYVLAFWASNMVSFWHFALVADKIIVNK